MIVDTFCFYNELDVLDIRLAQLYPVVDKFIISESSFTQSLKPKPFFFELAKERYAQYMDKIVNIRLTDKIEVPDYPWAHENYQRVYIEKALKQLNLSDSDIVMVSDVDEIPTQDFVRSLPASDDDIVVAGLTYHVYYLNLIMTGKCWTGTVASKWKYAKRINPHNLIKMRDNGFEWRIPNTSGWHIGYQGGMKAVYDKYFATIEPFDKSRIPDAETFAQIFKDRAKPGGSFIFCDNIDREDLKLEAYDVAKLPEYVRNNRDKFKHMLYE